MPCQRKESNTKNDTHAKDLFQMVGYADNKVFNARFKCIKHAHKRVIYPRSANRKNKQFSQQFYNESPDWIYQQ